MFLKESDEVWPQSNEIHEAALRNLLKGCAGKTAQVVIERIKESEAIHGKRRSWVWAELDQAPLAVALKHLTTLAETCGKPVAGGALDDLVAAYVNGGWCADAATLDALGVVDRDLAALYGVETKNLNKAVRRNLDRFPADFMFQLTADEANASRFQFGTLKRGQNIKYLPYAFTQEGVAMLSSVLRSSRAVQVNIAIMRVFVRLRETLALHKELAHKLAELEEELKSRLDLRETAIVEVLQRVMDILDPPPQPEPKRRQIGFHAADHKEEE